MDCPDKISNYIIFSRIGHLATFFSILYNFVIFMILYKIEKKVAIWPEEPSKPYFSTVSAWPLLKKKWAIGHFFWPFLQTVDQSLFEFCIKSGQLASFENKSGQ